MLYYETCQAIWGGSPATEQLEIGLGSTDLNGAPKSPSNSPITTTNDVGDCAGTDGEGTGDDTVTRRRNLLDKHLMEHRQLKLKRKLPVHMQLLACAQEELALKKQLIDHMEKAENKYHDNMAMLSSSMEHLTDSITEGFSLLQNILIQPHPPLHSDSVLTIIIIIHYISYT